MNCPECNAPLVPVFWRGGASPNFGVECSGCDFTATCNERRLIEAALLSKKDHAEEGE